MVILTTRQTDVLMTIFTLEEKFITTKISKFTYLFFFLGHVLLCVYIAY